MKREFRTINMKVTPDPESRKVTGYFAKFNSLSEDLGNFREKIAPGAFKRTLQANPDVRALVDHDWAKIIGRTSAGTLQLSEDATGLAFTVELPDTTYANDLRESMLRGDIDSCSFGFVCEKDSWEQRDGVRIRTLNDVNLLEGSIVALPAYQDTSAQLRSMFPDGQVTPPVEKRDNEGCTCDCAECLGGDCSQCSDTDCDCDGCDCDMGADDFDGERNRMQMELEYRERKFKLSN